MKRIIIIACSVLLALFIALTVVPLRDEENGDGDSSLYIPKGANARTVRDSLANNPSIRMISPFTLALKCATFFRPIQAGCYTLNDLCALRLIRNITSGQQTPVKVTFNNIRTIDLLASRLANQMMADSTAFMKTFRDDSLLNAYGCDSATIVAIFIPDTYEAYWTDSPASLVKKMHKNYLSFWNEHRRALSDSIGLTPLEVVTLASIVEEESNLKSEQPTIAGLYINRLRKGMKLQADPTVKFALGDFSLKRIRMEHIDASASSPYNTYTHFGLPPAPIRIPDKQTINAVLNFERHKYLFMCAKGNGEPGHNFTVTFGEHRKNANNYQRHLNSRGIR